MTEDKPVTLTHSETKQAIRQERGKLADSIIELQNKTDMLKQIAAHRLEGVMSDMISLTHEGRKK